MIIYWLHISTGDMYKLINMGNFIPKYGDRKACYIFESLNSGLITIIEFGDLNWRPDHTFIPKMEEIT